MEYRSATETNPTKKYVSSRVGRLPSRPRVHKFTNCISCKKFAFLLGEALSEKGQHINNVIIIIISTFAF